MSIPTILCYLLLLENVVCLPPRYNTLDEFVQSQSATTTHARHRSLLGEVTDFFKSIAAVVIAVTGLVTIIGPCWCIVRCMRNGGEMKKSWCCPKSLSEYRRRQQLAQGRLKALDRLAALPINLDSSA